MELQRPKVGVGVFVFKDGKFLFHQRKGPSAGEGCWSLPGGHLEFGESFEDCARREVMEEAGVEIKNLSLGPYTNDIYPEEQKHYITIFVLSDYDSGEVRVMEPDKCYEWRWVDWDGLPEPLFKPIENLKKIGYTPFK